MSRWYQTVGLITCVIILETFLTKYAFIYSKNEKRILK